MAITEYYVNPAGSGSADGSSEANAMSWATLKTRMSGGAAAAGDRYNVIKGTYSLSATDTWTNDGSAVSPIIIRGYNVTPGDLDTPTYNADDSLVTTNYPVITYTQTNRLNATGADFLVFRNIKIEIGGTGTNAAGLSLGANSVAHQNYVSNPSTGASASGIAVTGANGVVENNDVALTGASGGLAAINTTASTRVIRNRIIDAPGAGILIPSGATNTVILDNVFFAAVVGPCVDVTNGTATTCWTIYGNTCQGKAIGIRVGAITFTALSYYGNNMLTDMSTAGILSLNDGTAQLAGVFSHNRFRDNVADVDGWDDWKAGATAGEVTTDTGAAASDYTDVATDKYRLISTSPGKGASSVTNRDIGAMQHTDPAAGGGNPTLIGEGGLIG